MLTPTSSPPTLRVAFYRTSSIGDVVLATACLDLLRQLPLPTEATWVGRGASLEMLASSFPDLRTLEVRREDTLGDLQRAAEALAHTHLFIDLQCNLRSRWLGRQLRSATGAGVFQADKAQLRRSRLLLEARVRGRRRPLPERARDVPRHQFEMMCDALRQGLRHHLPVEMRDGLEALSVRPLLPIPDSFDSPWRKELRFGAWLGVAPGAAHPTKAAPTELFVDTLEKVKQQLAQADTDAPSPLGLVFFGDTRDRQVCRELLDELSWRGPVLNLAGRLSLWESAVALRETTCLLSNDSSLAHIAESVDTPTAVLFGPTIESFGFAPRMRQSRSFSSLVGCRPCSKHGRLPCRYSDKLCFNALSTDEVAGHLVSLLMSPEARFRKRQQQQALAALRRSRPRPAERDATAP